MKSDPKHHVEQMKSALEEIREGFAALARDSGKRRHLRLIHNAHYNDLKPGHTYLRHPPIPQAPWNLRYASDKIPTQTSKGRVSREIVLICDPDQVPPLLRLGRIGGKIVSLLVSTGLANLVRQWPFIEGNIDGAWWMFVFEAAWSGRLPLVTAERYLWFPPSPGFQEVGFPYDFGRVQESAKTGHLRPYSKLIAGWGGKLPDAWLSDIDDVESAGMHAASWLLANLHAVKGVEKWITVTDAAKELMDVVSGLDLKRAKARVSKAASSEKIRTNGKKGEGRRIKRDSLSTWLLAQRSRDLDAADG